MMWDSGVPIKQKYFYDDGRFLGEMAYKDGRPIRNEEFERIHKLLSEIGIDY